jgi:hypothetical protein
MIETILILVFSLALFVYWFRYTVLLLLSEEHADTEGAVISQLSLLETREALLQDGDLPLDRLHRALQNDYKMLRYLLGHAAGLNLRPLERFLLILDYRLMGAWYRMARTASASQARSALQEMAGVLSHIAFKMGERTLGASQA